MTEKEFQELKINFDKVIQSSQKIDAPMTWELLKNWEEAKSEFITLQGQVSAGLNNTIGKFDRCRRKEYNARDKKRR